MISAHDLAALLSSWRERQREVELALVGPGLSVKFSGIIDEISNTEFVIASNQNSVRLGFGKEADAHCTTFDQADEAQRIAMEHENLEANLELRPSDEISCSMSVKALILHVSQSKVPN